MLTDGKTLTSQPHLRSERMWILDDLRACKVTIEDPLKKLHSGPTAY
jgi:hypothetical protein